MLGNHEFVHFCENNFCHIINIIYVMNNINHNLLALAAALGKSFNIEKMKPVKI